MKTKYRSRGVAAVCLTNRRRKFDGGHYGKPRRLRDGEDPVFGAAVYRRQMRDVVECPKCGEKVLFSRMTWRGDHWRQCIERGGE